MPTVTPTEMLTASPVFPPAVSLIRPHAMQAAEQALFKSGVDEAGVMEQAGAGVADFVRRRFCRQAVTVLAGPGNNGGDGLVVARHLDQAGWPVTVLALDAECGWQGAAGIMADQWKGAVHPLSSETLPAKGLLVDALFGIGLSRPLPPALCALLTDLRRRALPSVAVDLPSGVDAATGQVLGAALPARASVTFHQPKPGHRLHPGSVLGGEVVVVDIGLGALPPAPDLADNSPALWGAHLPRLAPQAHKFSRGAVLVAGSGTMPGAAILACQGARRIGAGHVSLLLPDTISAQAALVHPGLVVRGARQPEEVVPLLRDSRLRAVVLGPGLSQGRSAQTLLDHVLDFPGLRVLDADALSLLAQHTHISMAGTPTVLTPHEGEFRRLFPDLGPGAGSKADRAIAAAQRVGAVVVLKGPDTVIAHPAGAAVINANAPPSLATAGSGDVLSGMIAGLGAQGMPPFEAAAAAVWLHGAAAMLAPPGLVAEDLPRLAAKALASLLASLLEDRTPFP